MEIIKRRTIHAGKLERWLGTEKIAYLQSCAAGWYGPPINLRDIPGSVWLTRDGDFAGGDGSGVDAASDMFALADLMGGYHEPVSLGRPFR